ncbi:MAG: sortase [Actinomycetota bacterium]|nr:sortase [Actinomycetota bacterium]
MKALRIFGKFLISVGVGVLLFVGWTLWGTGLYTQQQQEALRQEFDAQPVVAAPADEGPSGPPQGYAPGPGAPVFNLVMPSIDFDEIVIEGVGTEDLKRGPGHYPSCRPGFERPLCTEFEEVWPGEKGRVIVSGHRTTYGAPFFDLDKLQEGDEIITKTKWGEFTYEVTEKRIVRPDSLAIAIQSDAAEIVLTTCNPKYSAAQRLIVFGTLVTT